MTNAHIPVKESLERFYKGFHSFSNMNFGENFIVFKTGDVGGSVKSAEKRISELELPLEVISGKYPFNTYIVREARS